MTNSSDATEQDLAGVSVVVKSEHLLPKKALDVKLNISLLMYFFLMYSS